MANDREQNKHVEDDHETAEEPVQKILEQVEPTLRKLIVFKLLSML
jgi:hypothetical protein